MAQEVEQGRGLLHTLIYGESRLVADLDRLLGRAGTLLAAVERGEGALGVLLHDADAARAVKRVVTAADGLAESLERARDADGLLQALLFDPRGKEMVGDLRETARHFREVTARVARGEGLIGQLAQPGTEDTVKQFAQGLAGLGRLGSDLARTRGSARRSPTCAWRWPTSGRSRAQVGPARGRSAASSRTRRSTRTWRPSSRAPSGACSCAR